MIYSSKWQNDIHIVYSKNNAFQSFKLPSPVENYTIVLPEWAEDFLLNESATFKRFLENGIISNVFFDYFPESNTGKYKGHKKEINSTIDEEISELVAKKKISNPIIKTTHSCCE